MVKLEELQLAQLGQLLPFSSPLEELRLAGQLPFSSPWAGRELAELQPGAQPALTSETRRP